MPARACDPERGEATFATVTAHRPWSLLRRRRRPREEAQGAIASIKLVITSGETTFSTQRVILASFRSTFDPSPTTKRNDQDGDFYYSFECGT
ncbi:hypothetical protein K0M31_017043, partial [Melipona bicolor]